MRILAIETSCDETAAAVIEAENNDTEVKLLSNVVASSLSLHAKTGGIVPEVAAREQVKYIIPVIQQAMENGKWKMENLDAIAVTVGPGLIGSLLVGVETAKTLAFVWQKPIIPVNHLVGHIYANFVNNVILSEAKDLTRDSSSLDKLGTQNDKGKIGFPALALIVSGGHTDLVLMKDHQRLTWLGGTRDDATGEAFDKIGRLLGLPYPGGPAIAAAAEKYQISRQRRGSPKAANIKYQIELPRPLIDSEDFDFSFSGLKTAALREINRLKTMQQLNNAAIEQLSFEVQQAIVDVLVTKTIKAAQKYEVKSILLGGGVAANQKLREQMNLKIENLKLKISLSVPPPHLCTDNGAMIASAAFFNYKLLPWQKITANPSLHFDT